MKAKTLARGLGWFSIAVGLSELIAPQALARFLGMEKHTRVLRTFGLREIAVGVGFLLWPSRAAPLAWSRVGGDFMDLAGLGSALKGSPRKGHVGLALGSVLASTAMDAFCARRLGTRPT
ncbi:hypothetical protein [Pyxidicoccus trucidator]|uniref:hypothetical protein n=1 Tax=Pyxidicoccus trucidator TaxID=2709662 RepID=UPI0013DBE277|nr:hypothetical protein [Pyxidicoccus trucidator]